MWLQDMTVIHNYDKLYGTFEENTKPQKKFIVVPIEESVEKECSVFNICKHDAFFYFFCSIYVIYLIFGALAFSYLESGTEYNLIESAYNKKQRFLTKYPSVKG